jgi:hypothetical protein
MLHTRIHTHLHTYIHTYEYYLMAVDDIWTCDDGMCHPCSHTVMYVCMYLCMYICTYMCHPCSHTAVYICIRMSYACICMYACVHVCIESCKYVSMYLVNVCRTYRVRLWFEMLSFMSTSIQPCTGNCQRAQAFVNAHKRIDKCHPHVHLH